jgi:hypothetical protein
LKGDQSRGKKDFVPTAKIDMNPDFSKYREHTVHIFCRKADIEEALKKTQ